MEKWEEIFKYNFLPKFIIFWKIMICIELVNLFVGFFFKRVKQAERQVNGFQEERQKCKQYQDICKAFLINCKYVWTPIPSVWVFFPVLYRIYISLCMFWIFYFPISPTIYCHMLVYQSHKIIYKTILHIQTQVVNFFHILHFIYKTQWFVYYKKIIK